MVGKRNKVQRVGTDNKHILWLTDLHLDHLILTSVSGGPRLDEHRVHQFCKHLNNNITGSTTAGIVITGDISEDPYICTHLGWLDEYVTKDVPIWFVLGNHDFYFGGFKETREKVNRFCKGKSRLHHLPVSGVIKITENTALIGHEGWFDGGYANWFNNSVGMADYEYIREFKWQDRTVIFDRMQEQALEFVKHIGNSSKDVKSYKNLLVATHIPPWRENAVYQGQISNDMWMPCFSSKKSGDSLLALATNNPQTNITVLCGHSHGSAEHHVTKNMVCYTGFAKYGFPSIVKKVEIE